MVASFLRYSGSISSPTFTQIFSFHWPCPTNAWFHFQQFLFFVDPQIVRKTWWISFESEAPAPAALYQGVYTLPLLEWEKLLILCCLQIDFQWILVGFFAVFGFQAHNMLCCFPLFSSADMLTALGLATIANMSPCICILRFVRMIHELGCKMISRDFDFTIWLFCLVIVWILKFPKPVLQQYCKGIFPESPRSFKILRKW